MKELHTPSSLAAPWTPDWVGHASQGGGGCWPERRPACTTAKRRGQWTRNCGCEEEAVEGAMLRSQSCCCGLEGAVDVVADWRAGRGPEYRHRGAEAPNVRPIQPQEQNKREKRE